MKTIKVYSGIARLPVGLASDEIIKGCMVLEGGAFRGVYEEGVLDALMQEGINMQCTIGVSAGALNGMHYVAGQIGRAARINLTYRHYNKYVGVPALKKNKGVIGFEFLFKGLEKTDPFEEDRFKNPKKKFVAVVTNCLTGKAEYIDRDACSNIYQAIRASASMPYVSKMVNVDGNPCLDGGCACKIPYQWALDNGYDKIIVIKTRPDSFRRKPGSDRRNSMTRKLYRDYPEFAETLINSDNDYNAQCDEIEKLREQGRIFVISPSGPVTISRLEGNMEKLGELYQMGYQDGKDQIGALREYLGK